jgi:hypothetical protein
MELILDYIDRVFQDTFSDKILKNFYWNMFDDFQPDINGYTMIFMVPPDLSGFKESNSGFELEYSALTLSFIPFAAIDFTPPQYQVGTENVSLKTGAIPYATGVSTSTQCSITFIDNSDLMIYQFHSLWVKYIKLVVDGIVKPSDEYITGSKKGAIDYVASCYVVKWLPNMRTVRYIGKVTAMFPQSLPTKELIGQRSSNELTTLPLSYFCTKYDEALWTQRNHWVFSDFKNDVSRVLQ